MMTIPAAAVPTLHWANIAFNQPQGHWLSLSSIFCLLWCVGHLFFMVDSYGASPIQSHVIWSNTISWLHGFSLFCCLLNILGLLATPTTCTTFTIAYYFHSMRLNFGSNQVLWLRPSTIQRHHYRPRIFNDFLSSHACAHGWFWQHVCANSHRCTRYGLSETQWSYLDWNTIFHGFPRQPSSLRNSVSQSMHVCNFNQRRCMKGETMTESPDFGLYLSHVWSNGHTSSNDGTPLLA